MPVWVVVEKGTGVYVGVFSTYESAALYVSDVSPFRGVEYKIRYQYVFV